MSLRERLRATSAPREVVLIRFAVGLIFVSEGTQKFLFPAALGAGRFAKTGIPHPEILGPFVGTMEILCGSLVLLGLATRLAAIPLVFTMLVALTSTKLPILLGHAVWRFAAPAKGTGVWSMLHESRTDVAMLAGTLFLLAVGAGPWSVYGIARRSIRAHHHPLAKHEEDGAGGEEHQPADHRMERQARRDDRAADEPEDG